MLFRSIFLGGDSGYDTHFKMIGEKFGPFDFALLENGQYNLDWHYIHSLPEETAQIAQDLNVKGALGKIFFGISYVGRPNYSFKKEY